jgi:putative flippase GtrA
MIHKSQKNEKQKLISYIVIGLSTAIITFLLTSMFYRLFQIISTPKTRLSVSYFISSFIVIALSLGLNRKITFKGISRRHRKKIITIINYYCLYTLTALSASIFVYFFQTLISNININIYKIIAIFINVFFNYMGIRFYIFDSNKTY